ncbi:hypothetical protein AnigIFM50267_002921 [Aspergillus niger]|nr:hypothetical protein AnigIFM50267_002921 [Aspergillus niger]
MESRKRKADDELDPSIAESVSDVNPATVDSVPGVDSMTANSVPGAEPITADSISKVDPAMAAYIEKRRKEKEDFLIRQGRALWANYWIPREKQLSRPFGPLPNHPEVIEVWQRNEADQETASSEFPPNGITDKNPPLSYDVIASILWKTKGHCPKAQAWLKSHEMDRLLRGNVIVRHYGRENLRKQALHNRYQMNLALQKVAMRSAQEVDDVKENQENEVTTPWDRILAAHDRLRKAMGEPEVFAHEILLW